MRKCIFSFFCVFALASCSPKIASGVQEVRALDETRQLDSTALRRWISDELKEYVDSRFEREESSQTETVREVLSDPDTAGRQYVVERSTTRSVSGASTRAGSSAGRVRQMEERTDSVAVADSSHAESAEIYEEVDTGVGGKPFMPWYVYIGAMVLAVIVGFILGARSRNWRDVR